MNQSLLNTFLTTFFTRLGISPEVLVVIAVLVIVCGLMFCATLMPQTHDPLLEQKLKSIEEQLNIDPDNARLLLAKAEILFLFNTPLSCFALLERAYELGIPLVEIEPTYCACYRVISGCAGKGRARIYPTFWETAVSEAPKLTLELAVSPTAGDIMTTNRSKRSRLDTEARQKIIDTVDAFLAPSGDTVIGVTDTEAGNG